MTRLLICLFIISLWACTSSSQKENAIDVYSVPTKAGYISGKTSDDGMVKVFMGIPFAAPPVGDLRWKAPLPVASWQGTRACITPPASAMQPKPAPVSMWVTEFQPPVVPLSEDCLYLNVWTTAKNINDRLPVIVWIHGGALTTGSSTVPLYNGEELAKKGVVLVTINYRVGVFGFLAHPELKAESPYKSSGNYGILDQIAALKWVKENIASFGGDPDNVTIDGQSAGSASVNSLMVSPLAKGLFQRAIGQSGGIFASLMNNDPAKAEEAGIKYAEQVGANSITELRNKTTEEIMKIPFKAGVVLDNIVVYNPDKAFTEGKQNDVPLMTGWAADEFSAGQTVTAQAFKEKALKTYGSNAEEFLKIYSAATNEEASKSHRLSSVLNFGWQNYHWSCMQSKTGKCKIWLYLFTKVPPGEPYYGAFHSADLGYAFHNLHRWNRPFVKADFDFEDIMSSYWVNFAKTGNPNGQGLPEWPEFDLKSQRIIELGEVVKAKDFPFIEQMRFIDKINK